MPDINLPAPGERDWAPKLIGAIEKVNTDLDKRPTPESVDKTVADKAMRKGSVGLFGPDYVEVGDTNHTSMIKRALADAALGMKVAGLPSGTYTATDLVIPPNTTFDGWGGGSTRYGSGQQWRYGAVELRRPLGSTGTMVTLEGGGSGLVNVTLNGMGSNEPDDFRADPLLVCQGFETKLRSVRLIDAKGIAQDVQKANNVDWGFIRVDNSGGGTIDTPAVRVWSKLGVGSANETNNLEVDGWRIERSRGMAFSAGYGTTDEWWFEFLRIFNFHVENPLDATEKYATTLPLTLWGNFRSARVMGSFLYGGSGCLVRHNQRLNRSSGGNGGLHFDNADFWGHNPEHGVTPAAIELVAGTDFRASNARFHRFGTQLVSVQPGYGSYDLGAPYSTVKYQPVPVVTVATASGAKDPSILPRSDDTHGRIFWKTGDATAPGLLANVKLYHAQGDFEVSVTPKTRAAARLNWYVGVAADGSGFDIYSDNAPTPGEEYQFDYTLKRLGSL